MPLNRQNVVLTQAQETDRTFFINVHHTAYRSFIEAIFGWDAELQLGYANTAFDSKNIHVIWLNGEKVGVVGFDIKADHVWLKQLFILPDQQRKGVGRFAVDWVIEISRKTQKELRLQTLKSNPGAIEFYLKLGFDLTEETEVHKKLIMPYAKILAL